MTHNKLETLRAALLADAAHLRGHAAYWEDGEPIYLIDVAKRIEALLRATAVSPVGRPKAKARPSPDIAAVLLPGLLAAAWWASAPENTTARGPGDMPGGWRELFDEMEREAYAAILAQAAELQA